MTPQSILLGLGAGLISAIVFASATTGPMLSRVIFFLLTPFPLYLAGLGLGLFPVIAAAVIATLAILALSNPLTASLYAADAALPAVLLTRLTLLSRETDEGRVWYPAGRIVAAAALFAAAVTAAVLLGAGADFATLTEKLKPVVVEFIKTQMQAGPDGGPLKDEQIEAIAANTVPLIPGFLTMLLMGMSLISLWLAGRVTLASGRLARPWPIFSEMELPHGSALMLVAATALSFAGGKIGPAASCFAGAFHFAFALLGLAVVHHVTKGSPWRNFILAALYAALIVLTSYVLGLLTVAGLAETIFNYRRARPPLPPPSNT